MKGETHMKKLISLLLTLTLLAGCLPVAFAEGETRTFTDSTGRTIELPAQIDRIAVSGALAKMIVFAIAPDQMVGVPTPWDVGELPFVPEKYRDMTAIGQLYGGKGEMNLEQLLASDPQVVIDVGEPKGTIKEDMDKLTQQTGIPFIHIDASLATLDQAYLMLGELLGMQEEASVLSAWCKETYDRTVAISESVDKVSLLYITGEKEIDFPAFCGYSERKTQGESLCTFTKIIWAIITTATSIATPTSTPTTVWPTPTSIPTSTITTTSIPTTTTISTARVTPTTTATAARVTATAAPASASTPLWRS